MPHRQRVEANWSGTGKRRDEKGIRGLLRRHIVGGGRSNRKAGREAMVVLIWFSAGVVQNFESVAVEDADDGAGEVGKSRHTG